MKGNYTLTLTLNRRHEISNISVKDDEDRIVTVTGPTTIDLNHPYKTDESFSGLTTIPIVTFTGSQTCCIQTGPKTWFCWSC
jgi:hypothetical protein